MSSSPVPNCPTPMPPIEAEEAMSFSTPPPSTTTVPSLPALWAIPMPWPVVTRVPFDVNVPVPARTFTVPPLMSSVPLPL